MTTATAIDPARFRSVMGHFCTGVAVITACEEDEPVGFACQSFAALSLDPPLVLFCPTTTSRTWPVIERAGKFAVNVLARDQQDVSNVFGSPGTAKFSSVEWSVAPSGSPLLAGALTWVECDLETVYPGGDHHIVIGRVTALGGESAGLPLLFYQGRYTVAEGETADSLLGIEAGPDDWL